MTSVSVSVGVLLEAVEPFDWIVTVDLAVDYLGEVGAA